MKKLETSYLGLALSSPVIVSSSPFTASVESIVELEKAGAGAVVLKSIFEEQIDGEAATLEHYSAYPEASGYLARYLEADYIRGFLDMIAALKRTTKIPVIASINCAESGSWVDYAKQIAAAGADALELNVFFLATDDRSSAAAIEERYASIVGAVAEAVSIPVSVKLSPRFTNIHAVLRALYNRGAKGATLYNRFFEPDIVVDEMRLTASDSLSGPKELRNVLRDVALSSSLLPPLELSVSTGVHTGDDVLKCLPAGATTAQVCTALYLQGTGVIGRMNERIAQWMDAHGFHSIDQFRGAMRAELRPDKNDPNGRVQYMRFFPQK